MQHITFNDFAPNQIQMYSLSLAKSIITKKSFYYFLFMMYGVNEDTQQVCYVYATEKLNNQIDEFVGKLLIIDKWKYIFKETGMLFASNNLSERDKEFVEWDNYLIELMCRAFGITKSQLDAEK